MSPTPAPPPAAARLPDGFEVVLDPRVRRLGAGALLGGAPVRLLRLAPRARTLLAGSDRLRVRDATSAALARALLDAGVAHPRPVGGGTPDVTVVVPVRDRTDGLDVLLGAVRATAGDIPVLVVDDGSRDPGAVRAVCRRHDAVVLRNETAGGPSQARNRGLAAATSPVVALLDSDCVPRPGWLAQLARHLDDPLVAVVAPRIVAAGPPVPGDAPRMHRWVAGYEQVASALDLGPREGPVHPHGGVPYVPSAALLVRRAALGGGYDESMHVAEDVDLVWRLVGAGWRVRYEPAAAVAHDHRTRPVAWARRRAFYGTGAAPLAARHAASVAPVVLSPVSALAWGLLLLLHRPWGPLGAAAVLAWSTRTLSRRLGDVSTPERTAARLVVLGTGYAARQLSSAAVRHYWPLSAILALGSARARRLLVVAAVLDGVCGWWPRRRLVPFLPYLAARRIDDVSYGLGLWWGAWRARDLAALTPSSGRPRAELSS